MDVDVGIAGVDEPVGRVVSFKTRFVSRNCNLKGTLEKIPTVFLLFIQVASSEPEAEQYIVGYTYVRTTAKLTFTGRRDSEKSLVVDMRLWPGAAACQW